MPKELLKKFMPNPEMIKNHKNLQFLGKKLHDPNLWHLNRRSVSMAFAVGLFCAWIPVPSQMAIAAAVAFYVRANLPISVALVWITNPITMPPLFYFAYLIGLSFLNLPSADFSVDAVLSGQLLLPFLTGCLIMGVICASIGYFGCNYFWRYQITKKSTSRQQKREQASPQKNPCRSVDWRL